MNEKRLNNKISDQAKIFKSRANKSPEDMKRHDLIRPDEQKMMWAAYNQLGWSYAKIGSIFDRDPRAVAKKVTEFSRVKGEHSRQDDSPSLGTNAVSVSTTSQEKSGSCPAPPDNVDVVILKNWGVPAQKAPEIVFNWRSYHRQGKHDICQLFSHFREDLVTRKIPFNNAEAMLEEGIRANIFHVEKAHQDVDMARAYRPWESIKNRKALFREMQERDKPIYEGRQKHLEEIENLLKKLRDDVLSSLSTQEYDDVLRVEEHPLFESLMSHCFDVAATFMNLKFNHATLQRLNPDITCSEANQIPGSTKNEELLTLQKKTVSSIKDLQRAIDKTLKKQWYSNEWCLDCTQGAKIETIS